MVMNDFWIIEQGSKIINPFTPSHVKSIKSMAGSLVENTPWIPALSYGVSSYGYDLQLADTHFKIFKNEGEIIDPKNFDSSFLEDAKIHCSPNGDYFVIPPNGYALGVSVERVTMPRNITGICLGKSTYARCGIATNITPIDAGFDGHITLEFANLSPNPVRMYANEGCTQLIFFEGRPCKVSYADRRGKYQNQKKEVVSARI